MAKHGKKIEKPETALALWRTVDGDLRDMARFAREAIAQSGTNGVAQQACFHACVIAYGRCFAASRGGRPLLTEGDVKRFAPAYRDVQRELHHWRNKVVAHDEYPESRSVVGATKLADVSLVGGLTATFISPPNEKLREIAAFAERLNDGLVQPEIERLQAVLMDRLLKAGA